MDFASEDMNIEEEAKKSSFKRFVGYKSKAEGRNLDVCVCGVQNSCGEQARFLHTQWRSPGRSGLCEGESVSTSVRQLLKIHA